MKKLISTVALAAISTTAYANVLMPEISRDGKTRNTSVLAVSQEKRSFIASNYLSQSLETDTVPAVDVDLSQLNMFGAFSANNFSFEGSYQKQDIEIGAADADVKRLDALFGFRVNKSLTLGLGLTENELSTALDDTIIEAGGTLVVNGTTLGASLAHHMLDSGTAEGDYTVLTMAFGKQVKDLSWETGIQYSTKGNDSYTADSRLGVFGNVTKISGNLELDARFKYEYGDYLQSNISDNDYSSLEMSVDAEFLVTPVFYVTPGLEYTMTSLPDYIDADTGILTAKVDLGYRANNLDGTFGLNYATGELEGIDLDGIGFNLNVGYNF
ncbi:hypothetical protein [Halobacteriovorax sp. ZH1_bin.1]|uniref:hypothetical protein n=1 Tax=Halobacteriovorax sp. ZH1_bin.1 TaxID=3157723 RepID=UPI0037152E7E